MEISFFEWKISFVIFMTTIVLSLGRVALGYRKKSLFTPFRILFAGTFISAMAYFYPLFLGEKLSAIPALITSFQHAFKLFALDGEYRDWVLAFTQYPDEIKDFYIVYGAVLNAFAPLLTFSFVLSFFKNLSAHLKYNIIYFGRKTHVFSELNDKTLALAKSIAKNNKPILGFIPKILIVFTDIIDRNEEESLELMEDAKELGAILFRKDLESVKFRWKRSLREVTFYLISEDESEKNRHTQSITERYDYNGVKLWVFSDDIRTELLLSSIIPNNMKVTRVNDIQSLIYHNLFEYGINLFKRARVKDNGEKVISAVIVGLGRYGKEMLKALIWFCQMEGYRIKISVFDADKKAAEKFADMCPEIMEKNKQRLEGESYYEIDIHSGIDISTPEFSEKLSLIRDATYIFVCLGDDESNLAAATKIRMICERTDYEYDSRKPDIETVIYDPNIRKANIGITWENIMQNEVCEQKTVYGVTNHRTEPYNILMTGDLENFYSENTVIDSNLVAEGKKFNRSYNVEGARVAFAENRMENEWHEFIEANGLKEEWEKHFEEWKSNRKEGGKIVLSEAKSNFSFVKDGEDAELATKRKDCWENIVYKTFDELIKQDAVKKEWIEKEKEEIRKADKSFRFEYNYRSSIAKAIHKHLIKDPYFNLESALKRWQDMTFEEKIKIGKIEHVRWNAYMRTEGYRFGQRNGLGKLHQDLVSVSKLSSETLRKDA